jgi:hypothetical protein
MSCLGTSFTRVSGHRCTSALALVVPARIEGELPEQLPVLGEDPDIQVGHENEDPDAGVVGAPARCGAGDCCGAR